jgi:hypothetical protein
MTNWPKIHLLEARLLWHRRKARYRHRMVERWKITGDRAYYWHQKHMKEGKPQLAAVNDREIVAARKSIDKWKKLLAPELAACHRLEVAIKALRPKPPAVPQGEGVCVPQTTWNPYRRKLANWIARELYDAVKHGAQGVVTSGVRTYAEQKALYENYLRGGNIAARPGSSNHEGWDYRLRKGAVDWSEPESLWSALNRKPSHKLIWAEHVGLRDTVHFSSTGRLHDGFPSYEERRAHSSRW